MSVRLSLLHVISPGRSDKGKMNVTMYWNPGTTGHDASMPLAEPHLGLSKIKTSLQDGFFSCTFLREVSGDVLREGFDVFCLSSL